MRDLAHFSTASALHETVQRYGSAAKEHIVSYTGFDAETGQSLSRSLKDIADYGVDPENAASNLKQHAGFAAENLEAAKSREEQIIAGRNPTTTRTDDMQKTGQKTETGNDIGQVNDPLYDLADVDAQGNYIPGSALQMKFVGSDPASCAEKLLSSKMDKYRAADVKIAVPADYFDGVKQYLDDKAARVQEQLEAAQKNGNAKLAEKLGRQLEKIKKTRDNLVKSKVTSQEALEAVKTPLKTTVKNIARVSHEAGVQGAKTGAIVGGTISLIKNAVQVAKGEKELKDAVFEVSKHTALSAAAGYGTAFTGTALASLMKSSSSEMVRIAGKSGLPAMMVSTVAAMGSTMLGYLRGEIDGVQCLQQLGSDGVKTVSSSLFAVIGQAAIPIPVVGGLVGGMLGYALASSSYAILLTSLQEAKLAKQQRNLVEAECRELCRLMQQYRQELQQLISRYLTSHMQVFNDTFVELKTALKIGDADYAIASANKITRTMGREPLFDTLDEFKRQLLSRERLEF